MGKLNVNVKVVNNSDGTKDANLTIGSPDGSIGVGVLMDAPSLRNVAALFIKTADEMDRVIQFPQRVEPCHVCAGIAHNYEPERVPRGMISVHYSTMDADYWTPCQPGPPVGPKAGA